MDAYNIDKSHDQFRLLKKVSIKHVIPEKISKMRVKYCAQVFSHTFSSVLFHMSSNLAESKNYKMVQKGEDTAYLCLFMDKLFDSVNCSGNKKGMGDSIYKSLISTDGVSAHEDLWNKAISVFHSMTYVKSKKCDRERTPVIGNWILTLNGFKLLRRKMFELGFTQFAGRLFNQDPVENFFSQIKQHGR